MTFCYLPIFMRFCLLSQGLDKLTPEQREEVHRVCDVIPDVDVKVDIFVEDEGEIAENDLVTIKVLVGNILHSFFSCRYFW